MMHRDTLRYAAVRSGLCKRNQSAEALHMRARPAIYRIKRITPAGVATLQVRCGRTVEVHLEHLAPCHLANMDPPIDVTLQKPDADTAVKCAGTHMMLPTCCCVTSATQVGTTTAW